MEAKDHSLIGRKLASIARAFLCGNCPKARIKNALVACVACGALWSCSAVGVAIGHSYLQFSRALIFGFALSGIILATGIFMHRFVQGNFCEVDLIRSARSAGKRAIFRRVTLRPAVRDLQGGRWTKDWCGGVQDWRTRLSGRGWTDRRRSG